MGETKKRLIHMIRPDFIHEDKRGTLIQLVGGGYNQINVIHSEQGTERGNHYHRQNREAFYIIRGKLRISAWMVDRESTEILTGSKETAECGSGDMFEIGPWVLHTFHYLEETVLVSLYDRGVETGDGEMDIWGAAQKQGGKETPCGEV